MMRIIVVRIAIIGIGVLVCVVMHFSMMCAEPQPNTTPQTTLAAFRRILAESGEEPQTGGHVSGRGLR